MEETFKAKDLKFRQNARTKQLYASINAESGLEKVVEILVTLGKVIAYDVYKKDGEYTYVYQNAEDGENYSNVYNFKSTLNRLLGENVDDEKEYNYSQLRTIESEINKKSREMYTNVFEVEEVQQPEHAFLKKGQVFLAKNYTFDDGTLTHMEFVDAFGDDRIIYDYSSGIFMREVGDEYKVIPTLREVFKEIPIESLKDVKKSAFDGTLTIKGITREALKKLNEKQAIENQPGSGE